MAEPPSLGELTPEEIERWTRAAETNAANLRTVADRVAAVRVTETSRDGLVRVTVEPSGAVSGLEISDRCRGMSGAELSAAVLATMRKAQSRLAGEVSGVVQGTVDGDTATALVASYEQRFPEPEPDSPPWADQVRPSTPARPRRPAADEDWDGPQVTE
ncbi:YbaB/EbfC family nucleoid-associated protein [Saccharothrix violaceirubra]|uniref:DNA-binding protein YbaB n=1 Tax=Saccharothrix violaceirubra TaxID=413306 RepID=A0A7W7T5C6_9PSEU|nr:YbaB/EbfC family nucleoid-associated protein [Saccharothrix violaceirubra]MBB4966282.1 DNA-binding protein YbaB [Saccharothrix violaceirubra]